MGAISLTHRDSQHHLWQLFPRAQETAQRCCKLKFTPTSFNIHTDNEDSLSASVSIPLVTLLPLPLLQIKEADFDFDRRSRSM
ncbi:MAG: DUF2589 domain-containing protein [Bacteroidaceae bacterium]|nr:DUF2589 domain-containing protein [Bacteroidaceae bacterium]